MVGVFSIIVVMTAMRVLRKNIEEEMSELGANTFAIQKWPGIYFGGPEGFEKFWRRKNITLQQALLVRNGPRSPEMSGLKMNFGEGEVVSRYARTTPDVRLLGGTPGSFPAKNWTVAEGKAAHWPIAILMARMMFAFSGAS